VMARPARPELTPRTGTGGSESMPGAVVRARRQSDVDRQVAVAAGASTPGGGLPAVAGAGAAGPERAAAGFCPGAVVRADELPDGLVVADESGRVVVFNRAAERLTRISAARALGTDLRSALPLTDSEGRCWWDLSRPYDGLSIRTRHPERPLFLPDGTELLVTVGYTRASRCRGPRVGWQRRAGAVLRLTVALRGAEQRARADRARADLVSTVAHELRSPLTSVKGFTATLLAKWARFTDDQKKLMLETVNADADRVTRLITELLDVSRIEAGRMQIRREVVDVADRAGRIIAGRVAAGEPASRFVVRAAPGLPETWLDADKVDQILANLIENAVRHGAGTVTTVIEPALVRGEPGIAVSVRDQGPGIAPELAPRVFRQFWRGKRRAGAGLGLFIVKGLVEAHGGTITVGQAPGGGAEFRFTMPAGPTDRC